MKNKYVVIAMIVVLLAIIGVGIKVATTKTPEELIEIGEKYLVEENYEQALVCFNEVIEIDPLIPRGYTGSAEAYVGLDQMDEAIAVLEKGQLALPDDESINEMLETLLYEKERERLAGEANASLTEIARLCSIEDYDGVFELMNSEDFTKVSDLSKFLNRPYIENSEYGDIGIYEVDDANYGNFMIYFGDYVDGKRDGNGVWIGGFSDRTYMAKGEWKDDVPNGPMEIKRSESSNENIDFTTIKGEVVNGLWNGNAIHTIYQRDGDEIVFTRDFEMGKDVVIEIVEDHGDKRYLIGETIGEIQGTLHTDNPDRIQGIVGFTE